jgi:hypothetical protein
MALIVFSSFHHLVFCQAGPMHFPGAPSPSLAMGALLCDLDVRKAPASSSQAFHLTGVVVRQYQKEPCGLVGDHHSL